MIDYIPFAFVVLMVVATISLGLWSQRKSLTSTDFMVANRSVGVGMNASAISGEYLSAASFMGVAGLIMANGYDPMWYPVCFAAGYLFLLLFIAGPLRRFGAYTIPDFAEGRFDSPLFRKIAVTFVLLIGFFYTMPQMRGAGVTMQQILNWPYWAGIVVVGAVITFNVATGGMKGITFVQAFQYWAKLFAIMVPIFVLMAVFGGYKENFSKNVTAPTSYPTLTEASQLVLPRSTSIDVKPVVGITELGLPQGATVSLANAGGLLITPRLTEGQKLPAGSALTIERTEPSIAPILKLSAPVDLGTRQFEVIGQAGSPAPGSPRSDRWMSPFGPFTNKQGYPLLYTYSLIVALVCGTAGLPHILVRFYTNPDGRAAKRTTLWVMILIGVFYIFTPIWGTLGRQIVPELYSSATDAVVINAPRALVSPIWGAILSGITSAGAFAAFMSTFSGLLVSMSGALAHDIYGKILRPNASEKSRMTAFKVSSVIIGIVAILLGLFVESFQIAKMVGWAFAIGAASYFPLLLLGSWWRGLTMIGAATGMLLGGLLSLGCIVTVMIVDAMKLEVTIPPLARVLMEQPSIWAVPMSLLIMFVVSKMTSSTLPSDVDIKMLRLHAPEELGLSKNYIEN